MLTQLSKQPFVIAQISDSHLFGDIEKCHFHANVYNNLLAILIEISKDSAIDAVFFTGDLTQDHSEQSYQRFRQAVSNAKITVPFYYLAGNHDEVELLNEFLVGKPFFEQKVIENGNWQIILVNSKTSTPRGEVNDSELTWLRHVTNSNKHQLLMMHHHPVNVNYFIDNDHLQKKAIFWQTINKLNSIKMIACGHVHRALVLKPKQILDSENEPNFEQLVPVYTCPATSIQFDPNAPTIKATTEHGGYRIFHLFDDGNFTTEVKFLSDSKLVNITNAGEDRKN